MAIHVKLTISDCLQDCPNARIENGRVVCNQMDPPMDLGEFKLPLPFIPPHKLCPWLANDGTTKD